MTKDKKGSSFLRFLIFALLLGFSIAGGFLLGTITGRLFADGMPAEERILILGGMIIAIYLAVTVQLIVHEAGHLVFGLISGYRFSSFRIFSLMWVKGADGIKLRRFSLAGTGGQCLMAPPDMVDGKIPVVLYNLGGTIMNIITAAVFAVLCILLWELPFISTAALLLAVIGFVFAIINGVPIRTGTVDNDGYNAIQLTKSEKAMRAFWIQLKVNEQVALGVRLRDMPSEWFELPEDVDMNNSMVATLGVFATNRLMDEMRFAEAQALMSHLLKCADGMNGLHRELMVMDSTYCELISENRASVISSILTKNTLRLMRQMKNFPSVIRTEHAYALLHEKDFKKAALCKLRFENCAKKYPYPNDIKSERELIELAERQSGMNL